MRHILIWILSIFFFYTGSVHSVWAASADDSSSKNQTKQKRNYDFYGTISREVLENYLSRSITFSAVLHPKGHVDDNVRMIKNIGAMFLGRAIYRWGGEAQLEELLSRAKPIAAKYHHANPDIILQAAAFEIVTEQVNQIPVPKEIFREFNLKPEIRNFRYTDMLYPDGHRVNHWRQGASVPDMSQLETRMWFTYLSARYIDIGIEAIHFGQVEIMDDRDPEHVYWRDMLKRVRQYARKHARRRLLICDAHVPSGGIVHDGKLMFDLHSFPLRIEEVPDKPQQGVLKMGYLDSIFGRSKGGLTPSGWQCKNLPFIVELDNFERSGREGKNIGGHWIWGYDEICWFAHQPEDYRNQWLRYVWHWIRRHDKNGYLQMPGSRILAAPVGKKRWYWANRPSPAVPDGFNQEDTIKDIWQSTSPLSRLQQWLQKPKADRPAWEQREFIQTSLTKSQALQAQNLLWEDYAASLKKERAKEWHDKVIQLGDHTMRFDYKIFGSKPKEGWSLFISLHGGGGTAARINDQQWRNQLRLYETPPGSIYLAPRAPTNDWDLWHKKHIDTFFSRLIQDAVVLEGVNPNRVYLMGYSAGGDGVYQVAPRMADRWAAAAMMAGHPNETSPLGLRNLGFTIHVGADDKGYNRNKVARQWKQKLASLKQQDPDGYPHEVHLHDKHGHWMKGKDKVAISWMNKFHRRSFPEKIVWKQDNVTHTRFYWLAVPEEHARKGTEIIARCNGSKIYLEKAEDVPVIHVRLCDDMLNLDEQIEVLWDNQVVFHGIAPRCLATMAKTLHEYGDPHLIFTAEITVSKPKR